MDHYNRQQSESSAKINGRYKVTTAALCLGMVYAHRLPAENNSHNPYC